jgi:hypothetical protein
MGFRKPKSMLKGLEIKKPTDIEVEECKEGHSHGHGQGHKKKKGFIEDSDASDQFFDHKSDSSEESEEDSSDEEDIEIPEESKISRTLGDNTTRTVVILVLSLLIMQSACSVETYVDVVHVHE